MSKQQQRTPHGPGGGPGAQRPMGFGGPGMMTMPGQKAKNFKGTLRRLLSYLKPYRFRLTIVFLAAALSTVFGILNSPSEADRCDSAGHSAPSGKTRAGNA